MPLLDDAESFVNAIAGPLAALPINGGVVTAGGSTPFNMVEGYPYGEFNIAANTSEITKLRENVLTYLDITVTPIRLYSFGVDWTYTTYSGTLPKVRRNSIVFSPLTSRAFYFDSNLKPTEIQRSLMELQWSLLDLSTFSINEIAYGNNIFVGISVSGSNYQAVTSPDGIVWTPRGSATTTPWRSVVFGNGLFVMVGTNQIQTSSDGITWTARTSPANNNWVSVAYGGGVYVAVSSDGGTNQVMSSTLGTAWVSRANPNNSTWSRVTYGNGLFVAVATSGTDRIMTSVSGNGWTSRSIDSYLNLSDVVYGGGNFIAVSSAVPGTSEGFIHSTDGALWRRLVTPLSTNGVQPQWQSIHYGNGEFIAFANNAGSDGYCLARSVDGIQWKRHLWDSVTHPVNYVIHAADRYLVSGGSKIALAFTK